MHEPARETPVHDETDVLVVGGGPGRLRRGCRRRGGWAPRVTLVERYNHLGGLSTGGLVIWIDRMTDWEGRQVITRLRVGDPRAAPGGRDRRRPAGAVGLDRPEDGRPLARAAERVPRHGHLVAR